MYIGPAQQIVNAFSGAGKTSAAQKHMFDVLKAQHSGTSPAGAGRPYTQTLLDLSRSDDSYSSMFDVLRIEPNAKSVIFDMMKKAGVF